MISLDSYRVPVLTPFARKYATLSSAWTGDLPNNWDFDWAALRGISDKDCQCIVKLTLDDQCLGLIRFGLYYSESPTYIEIEQLESRPSSRGALDERLAKPVGMWLIWYAIKTGLKYCKPLEGKAFVLLSAYEDALEYYRDKVEMELVGPVAIAPGEDGYLFRFFLSQAKSFCEQIEKMYGSPVG